MSGAARLAGACGLVALLAGATDQPSPAMAAAPRYWAAAELQTRPQIKTHVMPEYPGDLPSGGRGRVVLDLYISVTGAVDRVRVVRASPPGRFEQSAIKAFTPARFTPGIRKGVPVPSRLRVEVTFGD